MAEAGSAAQRREDRASDRDDVARRRDEAAVERDTQSQQRDDVAAQRDIAARERMQNLAVRVDQARGLLFRHLCHMEATEPDPERQAALAGDREFICRLLDEFLDELHHSRVLRWAVREDRRVSAADRRAAEHDRSAAAIDRFAAIGDREQAIIEREQADHPT